MGDVAVPPGVARNIDLAHHAVGTGALGDRDPARQCPSEILGPEARHGVAQPDADGEGDGQSQQHSRQQIEQHGHDGGEQRERHVGGNVLCIGELAEPQICGAAKDAMRSPGIEARPFQSVAGNCRQNVHRHDEAPLLRACVG